MAGEVQALQKAQADIAASVANALSELTAQAGSIATLSQQVKDLQAALAAVPPSTDLAPVQAAANALEASAAQLQAKVDALHAPPAAPSA